MNNGKVKDAVFEVLEEDLRTRDNDKWLIIMTLRKLGFKIFIDYSELKNMPSFETITRSRRMIQNAEGNFIPDEHGKEYYYPKFKGTTLNW